MHNDTLPQASQRHRFQPDYMAGSDSGYRQSDGEPRWASWLMLLFLVAVAILCFAYFG